MGRLSPNLAKPQNVNSNMTINCYVNIMTDIFTPLYKEFSDDIELSEESKAVEELLSKYTLKVRHLFDKLKVYKNEESFKATCEYLIKNDEAKDTKELLTASTTIQFKFITDSLIKDFVNLLDEQL